MAGGLWYGARVWRSPLSTRYQMLLVVLVVGTAPLIAARSIAAGVLCSVLAGLAIAPVFSCQYALVGRSVTPGSETEAFTWISAALIGGLAAGSAIGGRTPALHAAAAQGEARRRGGSPAVGVRATGGDAGGADLARATPTRPIPAPRPVVPIPAPVCPPR